MQPEHQDLWLRIEQYPLHEPGSPFPFSSKLAKQNGWSPEFTGKAILEYRRFVFLGMVAGHPVFPSIDVDEVWHLHLQYTDDYINASAPKI